METWLKLNDVKDVISKVRLIVNCITFQIKETKSSIRAFLALIATVTLGI